LDRFMFHVLVDYPTQDEELQIVRQTTTDVEPQVTATLSGPQIMALQRIVRRVPVADHVFRYALELVRQTRPDKADAPDFVRQYIQWGAGPRASQYLILGAKARAVLQGRFYAACDDVRAVAYPVLRHRILTNFNAEAEGIKPDHLIGRLIAGTKAEGDGRADDLPRVLKPPPVEA
jgi:MoxR-like ATPase